MTRRAITFKIDPELVERLDRTATERGCRKTDLIEAGIVLACGGPPPKGRRGRVDRALQMPEFHRPWLS